MAKASSPSPMRLRNCSRIMDPEPGALGGIDGLRERLHEGVERPRPGDAVVDAGCSRAVSSALLRTEMDRLPLVVWKVTQICIPRCFSSSSQCARRSADSDAERGHSLVVVGLVVDVEALLLEEQALGVRLLRVDDELLQAVGERLQDALLAELHEVGLQDPVQHRMGFVRKARKAEHEGQGTQGGLLDFRDVDGGGHSPQSISGSGGRRE